ncbi:MAG: chromosome partitioning protein ParB, partial [Flavobacterium sp.]|nr:chromosome partitioning protein ParB [Flavobacterium sp.]
MDNATYKTRKLYQLDITLLKPDQNQPRKYFDETAINELTESIKQLGVLQPIIFRVDENNNPILVAGERRFMASQKAGLTKIPAIYIDGKADEIAIVENLLRMDLTPLEEAEALQTMKAKYQYTDDQLSQVIGKARTTISDILIINNLPDAIKENCRQSNVVPKTTLSKIARMKSPDKMLISYEKASKHKLTSREVNTVTKQDQAKTILTFTKSLTKILTQPEINIADENREKVKCDLQ